jgi:Fe-S-cluster containining protein
MTTPTDPCQSCGLCCTRQSSPPFMPDEMDALPPDLRDGINRYLDSPLFDDNAPCIWLDRTTTRCMHHEHRPGVCRDYPVGGSDCRNTRASVGLTLEGLPTVSPEDDEL